ncbi:MAG: hypothetical protein ACFFFH_06875 [Candidatus Thorarchaeota archaeon]
MQTKTTKNKQILVHTVTSLRELAIRITIPLSMAEKDISVANFVNPAFYEGIKLLITFNRSILWNNSLVLVINATTLTKGGFIVLKRVESQKERFNN